MESAYTYCIRWMYSDKPCIWTQIHFTYLLKLHAGSGHPVAWRYGAVHRILHEFILHSPCNCGLRSFGVLHNVGFCDPLHNRDDNQVCKQWHCLVRAWTCMFPGSTRSFVTKDYGKSQVLSAKWPVIRLKLRTDSRWIQYRSLSIRQNTRAWKYLYIHYHRTMSVVHLVVSSNRAFH